jgi:hypothetical protein
MYRVVLCAIVALPLAAQEYDAREFLSLLEATPGATIHEKIKALDSQGVRLGRSRTTLNAQQRPQPQPAPPQTQPQRPPQQTEQNPQQLPLSWTYSRQRPNGENKVPDDLNLNRSTPNTMSNSFGPSGTAFRPESVNDLYGYYGIPYTPFRAENPYASQGPAPATPNGAFFGRYGGSRYSSNPGGIPTAPSFPGPRNPYNPYSPNLPATPQVPAMPHFSALPQR